MLLYQFLSSCLPYSIICGVIGITIMIIREATDYLQGKNIYVLAYTLILIFIATCYSFIPLKLASDIIEIILFFLFVGAILFAILFALYAEEDYNPITLFLLFIIYIICFITYLMVLRPTLISIQDDNNVETKEVMINEPETYNLCIFEDINLNNIPIYITETNQENNNEDKDKDVDKDENNIISYWYLKDNNEALYASANALDSVLLLQEENSTPYVEIQNYITIENKSNNNYLKIEDDAERKQVFIFHLPKSLAKIK